MDAHCEAGFLVGLPFASDGLYDFGSHGNMTGRWDTLDIFIDIQSLVVKDCVPYVPHSGFRSWVQSC